MTPRRFKDELERLRWLYAHAPKGRKEYWAKRLRDHVTALLRAEQTAKRRAA